jgi:plasmid stabilization system protein ParE
LYELKISKLFQEDTSSSYNYIKNKLKAPMAANNLRQEVKAKLDKISETPTHRPLVYDKYLANLGYRLQQIKNYLIFYIIGDDDKHVKIVRYLYCKRNWIEILKEINLEELFDES